jgi:hypothetical protein
MSKPPVSRLGLLMADWEKTVQALPPDQRMSGDAEWADLFGLSTLAFLLRQQAQLASSSTPISPKELVTLLHKASSIARGEANGRIQQLAGPRAVAVPGESEPSSNSLEHTWRILSVEQAAAELAQQDFGRGFSVPTIRAACRTGELLCEFRGREYYIHAIDLFDWAEDKRKQKQRRTPDPNKVKKRLSFYKEI